MQATSATFTEFIRGLFSFCVEDFFEWRWWFELGVGGLRKRGSFGRRDLCRGCLTFDRTEVFSAGTSIPAEDA
ncbi:hypothetical protein ES703_58740 [subsurface metagenome]